MKTLIVMFMICGKPDSFLIREVGKEPKHLDVKILMIEKNYKRFMQLSREAEKISVDVTQGMCV